MKMMKNGLLGIALTAMILSCGSKPQTATESDTDESSSATTEEPSGSKNDASSYDPKRGEGKFNAENVAIGASLDATMANAGEKVKDVKCASCHKTSEEKLVGPGWKGVTTRREPAWIMNFITNPDPMIDKDPEVQAQLEICLVRMPNQGLEEKEAREVLEFLRKNDGVK